MKQLFTNTDGIGQLKLINRKANFSQYYFKEPEDFSFHSIVWNSGSDQTVTIDEVEYHFASNTVLPIMHNQTFQFEHSDDLIIWQFNREFYCIVNHDAEVGCVGFLFFGPSPTMFIKLDEEQQHKMDQLLNLFIEEFETDEEIKGEMLRMLLVRLIIHLTRLAKKIYLENKEIAEDKFNLLRQYNLLVEIHFKQERQVKFYAGLLNRSPKTISNLFALYFKKSPLEVIHERVIAEAKRLFYYTDKSVKEIADELGFEDSSHFSKFFKNVTNQNPSELRKAVDQLK
jgi:AraC-like DNA-binding protein